MKISIRVKGAAEAKKLLDAISSKDDEVEVVVWPGKEQVPAKQSAKTPANSKLKPSVGTREPRHLKSSPRPNYPKRDTGYTSARWDDKAQADLAKFYMDPENHYDNGTLIGKNVKAYAKTANRTHGAVNVRIVNSGLNKKAVYGTKVRSKNAKRNKAMGNFPDLPNVKVPKQALIGVFKQLTSKQGNTLKFGKDNVASLGINSTEDWQTFVYQAIKHAKDICEALGKKPHIHMERNGTDVWITYGVEQ